MTNRKKNTKRDFEEYISSVFSESGETANFIQRFDKPTELDATVGMIAIKFAELEEKLSETIGLMLQIDRDRADIITAELSFNNKINLFSSLYHNLKNEHYFNTFPDFEDEYVRAFTGAMRRASDLRNRIVHSQIIKYSLNNIIIKKKTAKQSGLKRIEEKTSIINLLNIVDFLYSVIFELDQFQIEIMEPKEEAEKKWQHFQISTKK